MENQKAAEDSHKRENINSPLNNASFIDQAYLVEMAGWLDEMPCSFFFFFRVFMDCNFVMVHKKTQKSLANIQPSWPQLVNNAYTSSARQLYKCCNGITSLSRGRIFYNYVFCARQDSFYSILHLLLIGCTSWFEVTS